MPSFLKVFRRQQKKQTSTNGVPQRGTKRKRPSKGRDERVLAFTQWCKRVGIWLHPKIRIGREGSCAEIGVVAADDIGEGELVARIPRSALLTCANCTAVRSRLLRDDVTAARRDDMSSWVPLLLAMLAEYGQESASSWHPYLQLVPNYGSAHPPMLWSPSQLDTLLGGTSVVQRVHADMEDMSHDFSTLVLPFMLRHPDLYPPHLHTQDLYQQTVALVMSYSFSDASNRDLLQRTVMVPFVDLLNHHSHHHVELAFMEDHLDLVAIRPIKKGEEVMNTYGQLPNACLMHKYGFTELQNPNDEAYVMYHTMKELVLGYGSPVMQSRWRQLQREGLVDPHLMYPVGTEGLTDKRLTLTVKMLHGGKLRYAFLRHQLVKELDRHEDPELQDKGLKTSEDLGTLSSQETSFLKRLVQHSLEELSPSNECSQHASDRERFASLLCLGQHRCLTALLEKMG